MASSLFSDYIDKVFVFLRSDDSISFILPWFNFDYLFVSILVIITISFIFDLAFVFISSWRKSK